MLMSSLVYGSQVFSGNRFPGISLNDVVISAGSEENALDRLDLSSLAVPYLLATCVRFGQLFFLETDPLRVSPMNY